MCRTVRVWKLKTSINFLHLLGFGMEGSGRQNQLYFTCLEGSGRLNVSYSTCLEAQNVEEYITFDWFWDGRLREAKFVVLFTLRAVPPTQLSLIRVSL